MESHEKYVKKKILIRGPYRFRGYRAW